MANSNVQGDRLCVGPFAIDGTTPTISGPDGRQKLTPLAVRLLFQLADTAPHAVARRDLIAALWDGNDLIGEPALNRLVSEIRAAAALVADAPLIVTVPRAGYRLATRAAALETERPARERRIFFTPLTIVLLVAIIAATWLATLHIQQRPATAWQDYLRERD